MQKYAGEHLLFENIVSATNLQSLAKEYILNCRTEGKSADTLIATG